jgi:hypothetical protein
MTSAARGGAYTASHPSSAPAEAHEETRHACTVTSPREVSAADGMGVEEALLTLIELIDVSFSRGQEGFLAITPSTLNRWKKVSRITCATFHYLAFGLTRTRTRTRTRTTLWGW